MKAPRGVPDRYDDVPLPALLYATRGTYTEAIRRAQAKIGCDDVPASGEFILNAMEWTGASLDAVVRFMGVTKQAVSQSVEMLVDRGYLERGRDPSDRRRVTLSLTARGHAAGVAGRAAIGQVDQQLRARVGPESIARARHPGRAAGDQAEGSQARPVGGGMSAAPLARLANRDADFARLGLQRGHVEPWEDGMRTTGGPGSYEWWYFDSHLEDGSSLVVTFYTKWLLDPKGPEAPMVQINLDRPGRPTQQLFVRATPDQFRASKEHCDIRIKESYFRGDQHTYQVKVVADGLTVEAELVGQVPSWRQGTGVTYFGPHDEHTFAWLPSVPQGAVTATITEKGGPPRILHGIGYHDHNWGDVAMSKLLNHWYWGRAQAGTYSVIAAYLYAEKEYGRTELPQILIAKDGKVVADDASKVRLVLEDVFTDAHSKKPVANRVIYDYAADDGTRYRVIFQRSQTLLDQKFADTVTGIKHALAVIARVDGAYLRFSGTVTVEKYERGKLVETASDPGIWELMYLGHVE